MPRAFVKQPTFFVLMWLLLLLFFFFTDINACSLAPCNNTGAATAECTDTAAPALGDASGRTCTCPAGYTYTDALGCQSKPATAADWLLSSSLKLCFGPQHCNQHAWPRLAALTTYMGSISRQCVGRETSRLIGCEGCLFCADELVSQPKLYV